MRLLRNSVVLFLLLSWSSCDTKGDFEGDFKNYFLKYFGEDGNQFAVDMHVNDDGTIMILGRSETPVGPKRIFLVKTDSEGNVLWTKKFGGYPGFPSDDEYPQDLEAIGDGNFYILTNVLLGKDISTNEDIFDFKVIRVSGDGDRIDSLVFGNNNSKWSTQFAHSLTVLSNGGFAIAGNSQDETLYGEPTASLPPPDIEDIFYLAYTTNYTVMWNSVEFNDPYAISLGEYEGSGVRVFEKNLNEFYFFAYSDGLDGTPGDTYEPNFNTFYGSGNGLPLGPVRFAGRKTTYDVLASVIELPGPLGGGYLEIGTSSSLTGTFGELYFSRRTNSLSPVNEGTVNISGDFSAAAAAPSITSDGFLILATEQLPGGTTIRLVKTDLAVREIWSANFGTFNKENTGAQVTELPDGRILVLGTVELETQKKIALIKVNQNGEFLN